MKTERVRELIKRVEGRSADETRVVSMKLVWFDPTLIQTSIPDSFQHTALDGTPIITTE